MQTSDLQFAYKKKHSASAATLTLKEIVRYYKQKNTAVFAAVVDASKAFDRVRHDRLYKILQDRGIPPIALRLILSMYESQQSRCRYFDTVGEYYTVANGVRQGGVASPILFIIYMDILYERLEKAGIGCHIGSVFYGMIGYADDVILLATSVYALNRILRICTSFGNEFDVKYNAAKSKFIVLGNSRWESYENKVIFDGKTLKQVDHVDFLGNTIRGDLSEKTEIIEKVEDLFGRVNTIKYKLSGASYNVKSKIFTVKCAHAYGADTWNFSDRCTSGYWTAYGQSVRRLLGLPPSCPSITVDAIVGTKGAPQVIFKKFLNLTKSMNESDNSRVKFMFDNAMADARSLIRKNIACIKESWGGLQPPPFSPDSSDRTKNVRELLDAREGKTQLGLSAEEIDERMLLLCMR